MLCRRYRVKFDFGIPHVDRILAIELRFTNLESFSFSWIKEFTEIAPLEGKKDIPEPAELLDHAELLFDEIKVLDENVVQVGLIFWCRKKEINPLLVEIRAGKLEILEFQREAFSSLYDGIYLDLFDIYWSEKKKGRFFDDTSALQLIKEHS